MNKAKIFKNEPDRCPVCDGINTYVDNMEIRGETFKTTCGCNDCEASWDEWFVIRYVGYSKDDINYDSNGNKEE